MKRSWWLGVLTWLGVVVVASATAWAVIDTAGRQVLADPAPDALVPATSATASTSRAPSAVLSPRPPRSTSTATGSPEPEESGPSSGESSEAPRSSSSPDDRASDALSFTEGTWRGAAGTVIARCDGGAVRLHSATPTDSYQVEVGSTGPEELEVKFSGGAGEVRVDARCVGGEPRFEVESEAGED